MKTCVLILSAPRSGSSCLAGCVQLCGVSLGTVTAIKDKWNAKGYFENKRLHDFNVDTLPPVFFGSNSLNKKQINETLNQVDDLKRLIEREFETYEVFAIKDPRILLLEKLYLKVLSELNISVKILALHRDHVQASGSAIRGPWGGKHNIAKAHLKFERLLVKMCEHTTHMHVNFEDLLDYPVETMKDAADFIGVEPDLERIKDFVDKKLVHKEQNENHFNI